MGPRTTSLRLGRRHILTAVLAGWLCSASLAGVARAQADPILLDGVEDLDFDRPESWAMKYFTSVSMMTGLGVPERTIPGSVDLVLEGAIVPTLGEEKRRVGFVGNKVEDLNRTSAFGRARVDFGLPGDVTLTVGATPPLEIDGVTPKLLSFALARPVLESRGWRLGLRLHGQIGSLEGDLTCPENIAGVDDPVRNPDNCLEASNDEARQNYLGLEISAGSGRTVSRWQPFVAASVNYLDLEFRVRARYSIFVDRAVLRTDGWTWYLATGLGYQASERLDLRGELFYTPLDVVRSAGDRNDELATARFLLRYALRRPS